MKRFEQFEKIDFPQFVEEIFNASDNLFLSLPSIDDEMAEALILAKKQKPNLIINLVVDNSEESIRNGFGDIIGIDKILQSNIKVSQSDGNLISFIISDKVGYFLFPHSRIFIEKAKGTNAFRIDPVSIQLLKQYFFPNETQKNEFQETAIIGDANKHFKEAFNELNSIKHTSSQVSEFDKNIHNVNKDRLKVNPPNPPDLQRQINTYSAKIQFVELKFIGGNIENRIAQLPKKAIPINSEELKNLLQTRIKMFQNIDNNSDHKKLLDFKEKVERLRKDFLIPITCRPGKSVIKIDNKIEFLAKLEKLKKETETLNISFTTMLEEGKLNTLDLLKKELKVFFSANEPKEVRNIGRPDIKERKLEDIISTIAASVKFPEISKLIENISLRELFYDLTWNDFKDIKLQEEFREKNIMESDDIESIVKMKEAYETKR
jgi:hypothetical protein